MEKLLRMNKGQLADKYYNDFGLPGDRHNFNTLLAALYYNKRIKYLTEEEIEFVKQLN